MLIDSFGRTLDYLRVSITDRCNLRCVYCMPPEGVEWKPHESMLSFEELLRLCEIMADLGIRKIKVTGGEPLVRRGTASFINKLKALPGIEKVTLTTNGFLLGTYLDEVETIASASLPDGVNIHLDALDPDRLNRITQTGGIKPADIFPVIERLTEKKVPVKINCVPVRGYNEEEILPMAALAKDKNITVRFIELMPMGSGANLDLIPAREIEALLRKAYGDLVPFSGEESGDLGVQGNGPALYYSLPAFTGKIGFINPITHGFCESCNRLRLTSEGFFKLCLSHNIGLDLRQLLRSGAFDKDIVQAITETVAKKPGSHTFSDVYGTSGMFRIGG